MTIEAALYAFKHKHSGEKFFGLSLPFFPVKKSYCIEASLIPREGDWIIFPLKRGSLEQTVYLSVPSAAGLLKVAPEKIRGWNANGKFLTKVERKARLAALKALPAQFSNPKIQAALQSPELLTEYRSGDIEAFVEKNGRIVLVNNKTGDCWDLFRRQSAVHWKKKIHGKTVQILANGRRFLHLKERNCTYATGASKVCKFARDLLSKTRVARLVIKLSSSRGGGELQRYLKGLWILEQLKGVRGIVEQYGNVYSKGGDGNPKIVSYQRWYKYGDLMNFYNKHEILPEKTCDRIAETLLSALAEMHKRRIYHRDLKEENILIDGNPDNPNLYDAAICDLDFCWIEGEDLSRCCGTWRNTAPERALLIQKGELFKTKEADLAANDVWAMGLILYTLYHRDFLPGIPREKVSNEEIFKRLSRLVGMKGAPFFPTKPIDTLIHKMLQIDTKDRISAKDAYKEFRKLKESSILGPGTLRKWS